MAIIKVLLRALFEARLKAFFEALLRVPFEPRLSALFETRLEALFETLLPTLLFQVDDQLAVFSPEHHLAKQLADNKRLPSAITQLL